CQPEDRATVVGSAESGYPIEVAIGSQSETGQWIRAVQRNQRSQHRQNTGGRHFEDRTGRSSVEVAVVGEEKPCPRPSSGDLSEGKKRCKHAVGRHLEHCAATGAAAVSGAAVKLFIGAKRQLGHGGRAVWACEINQRGEDSVGGDLVELALNGGAA